MTAICDSTAAPAESRSARGGPVGWTCQAVPDERTALEAEIARLQTDNVALKKRTAGAQSRAPGGIRPDRRPEKVDRRRLQLPSDAEIDHMMAFVEQVWRRLVEMVVSAQRDMTAQVVSRRLSSDLGRRRPS